MQQEKSLMRHEGYEVYMLDNSDTPCCSAFLTGDVFYGSLEAVSGLFSIMLRKIHLVHVCMQ